MILNINGRDVEVDAAPLARLLDVLRAPMGLTGTKEGCGEGECGACSVLIDGDPVNACLVAAGQCVGRAITTVEGLANASLLSPLQRCFVEDGGAQCGICTPGMLIAAEALLRSNASPSEDDVRDAIAGNLCRCTGYQRIVDAIMHAAQVLPVRVSDPQTCSGDSRRVDEPGRSRGTPEGSRAVSARAFAPSGLERTDLARPRSVDEACRLLADARAVGRKAVILAGGTDWIVDRYLLPVEKAEPVDVVVDVTGIDELGRIASYERDGERRIVLGGGVTYWMLRWEKTVADAVPMLALMARDVGAVQTQTRGTLAGNIASASPAADGVPALMALGGEVRVRSAEGERVVPLDRFFTAYRRTVLAPHEIIVSIDCRVPRAGACVTWRKVGTRLAQAISKVALASVIEEDAGRVRHASFGMASVAAVTHPLSRVATYLVGRARSAVKRAELDDAVAQDIQPIDDLRSTGAYRLHVGKALVWRALSA